MKSAFPSGPSPRRKAGSIADLASRNHGVVSRQMLSEIGLSGRQIDHERSQGRLIAIHRGVYTVGHSALTWRGWELAAVLACGREESRLSHESAARFWGFREYPGPNPAGMPHVSTLGKVRRHPRVQCHRIRTSAPQDRVVENGIPVSSPAQTLLELASTLTLKGLGWSVNQARILGLLKVEEVLDVIERNPTAVGRANLRAQLADADYVRSEAERKFKQLLDEHGIRRPSFNTDLAGYEVDCHWPGTNLIVEIDGFTYHDSKQRFEYDHTKVGKLRNAGYDVLQITWQMIKKEPAMAIEWIRRALAGAKPDPRGPSELK